MSFVRRLKRDAKGGVAIEYSLIAALIGIVLLAASTNVGDALRDKFNNIANATK